jgi:hypothetical protein
MAGSPTDRSSGREPGDPLFVFTVTLTSSIVFAKASPIEGPAGLAGRKVGSRQVRVVVDQLQVLLGRGLTQDLAIVPFPDYGQWQRSSRRRRYAMVVNNDPCAWELAGTPTVAGVPLSAALPATADRRRAALDGRATRSGASSRRTEGSHADPEGTRSRDRPCLAGQRPPPSAVRATIDTWQNDFTSPTGSAPSIRRGCSTSS